MALEMVDFTQTVVSNPRGMKPGGAVGPIRYTRSRKNVIVSGGLKARNEMVAREVSRACSLADACLPTGMNPAAVGRPVPGKPGKVYTSCTADEAVRRLTTNLGCVTPILSTSGGIYGKGS